MLSKILPDSLNEIINTKIDVNKLYEIRLRQGRPIVLDYGGQSFFLSFDGISLTKQNAIFADDKIISSVVFKASNNSVYAINNQLQQGFITAYGGIRIGVCGELVIENGKVVTVKNFSSLNIRIPHEIKNCSLNAFNFLLDQSGEFRNTLIISPPGAGKTTFLRDIAKNLSDLDDKKNILILDERYEIAASVMGKNALNVGDYADCISGATKEFGFREGIRAMRPDIIFTDELATKSDLESVQIAASSGVKIVASVHAKTLTELRSKKNFNDVLDAGVFERFIVLSRKNGPGTYEAIYDEHFNMLFCR
jgi:stage III sporulation protein AA